MEKKRLLTDLPFKYQWLRDGQPIQGANKFAYVVQPEDIGCKLERVADYMISFEDSKYG